MSGDNGNNRGPNNKSGFRKYFNWIAGATLAAAVYSMMIGSPEDSPRTTTTPDNSTYSDSFRDAAGPPGAYPGSGYEAPAEKIRLDDRFWDDANRRLISDVVVLDTGRGMVVTGYHNGEDREFVFTTQDEDRLYTSLEDNNISYIEELQPAPQQTQAAPSSNSGGGGMGLFTLISLGFMGFIVWNILKQQGMGGGGGNPLSRMGGNKAKLLTKVDGVVTFEDVAGVEEAKEELMEVVDFLRNPYKYSRLGAKMPTGALLTGPPGTGKTLMARAVAGEADVPFYSISGSDFVEMFVGMGASRVRTMFEEAKKNSPCIIFIDEIDAVGKKRSGGAGMSGGNDEREQTLNQLLVEMDGFGTNDGIIIIAATNRPDSLDDALLRPGRFDRQVPVPLPLLNGREKILEVHAKKVPTATDVDLRQLAIGTPGFSGAQLANLINEGALLAAREGAKEVFMHHLEEAKDKVMMGNRSKTQIMSPEEKLATAYHEAGHALVGLKSDPPADPLYKITVIPRGRSLGVTINIPEKDQVSQRYNALMAKIAMIYGGRKTEEIIYGKDNISTGASNDIQQATNIAEKMIMEWGFSDKVGRRKFSAEQSNPFGGGGMKSVSYSEATAQKIDEEIDRLLDEGEKEAERILIEYREDLELIALALNEYEELNGKEVDYLLEHRVMPSPEMRAELAQQWNEERKRKDEENKQNAGENIANDNEKPDTDKNDITDEPGKPVLDRRNHFGPK